GMRRGDCGVESCASRHEQLTCPATARRPTAAAHYEYDISVRLALAGGHSCPSDAEAATRSPGDPRGLLLAPPTEHGLSHATGRHQRGPSNRRSQVLAFRG